MQTNRQRTLSISHTEFPDEPSKFI